MGTRIFDDLPATRQVIRIIYLNFVFTTLILLRHLMCHLTFLTVCIIAMSSPGPYIIFKTHFFNLSMFFCMFFVKFLKLTTFSKGKLHFVTLYHFSAHY